MMDAVAPGQRFPVILIDPPWKYSVFSKKGEGRSASQHYPTMGLEQICALPIPDVAAKDCHLFLWTTGTHLEQAFVMMRAWGFRYSSTAFVWVKIKQNAAPIFLYDFREFVVGMGKTTRKNCEFCLLGRKGSPRRKSRAVRELIVAPKREHSRKPDEQYERIEAYADGPYLEVFARQQWPGWTAAGNEINKFRVAP